MLQSTRQRTDRSTGWALSWRATGRHAEQLATLARHAETQMDAGGFFDLVHTPKKFDAGLRDRLDQIEKLVECALHDLGAAEADAVLVRQRTCSCSRCSPSSYPDSSPPTRRIGRLWRTASSRSREVLI